MIRPTLIWFAALWFAAGPALAVEDTTGLYEGKLKCSGQRGGAATKFKGDVSVAISEGEGGSLLMGVNGVPNFTSDTMGGFVLEDAAKADRGRISAVDCSLSYTSRNGASVHVEVVVKPGGAKASIKGTLVQMSVGDGESLVCTFTAKRTSTENPLFEACVI